MGQYDSDFTYYPNEDIDWLTENNLLEKANKDVEELKQQLRTSDPSKKEVVSEVFGLEIDNLHYLRYVTAELKKVGIEVIPPYNNNHSTDRLGNPYYRNLVRVRYQEIQDKGYEPDF